MGFKNKQRDIVLCVLYSIFSLGIYAVYWIYIMTEEANALSENEEGLANGVYTVIFGIITLGVYLWYWSFKMGSRLQTAREKRGVIGSTSNGVVYLILSIVQLDIVGMMLMQNELNKLAKFAEEEGLWQKQ